MTVNAINVIRRRRKTVGYTDEIPKKQSQLITLVYFRFDSKKRNHCIYKRSSSPRPSSPHQFPIFILNQTTHKTSVNLLVKLTWASDRSKRPTKLEGTKASRKKKRSRGRLIQHERPSFPPSTTWPVRRRRSPNKSSGEGRTRRNRLKSARQKVEQRTDRRKMEKMRNNEREREKRKKEE